MDNNYFLNKHPTVYDLLSTFGKHIYFPKNDITAQSADAKGKKINATIGIALENNNDPISLPAITKKINAHPKDFITYAPSAGNPDLRKQWQQDIIKKNPQLIQTKISLPVVTTGLTHALFTIGKLFVNAKDEIIIPNPCWGNYNLIFAENFNANILAPDLFKKQQLNLEQLANHLNSPGNKKVIILNFPNNPTGYTPTYAEANKIVSILHRVAEHKKILVICDDAYFGLIYQENILKESIFSLLANLSENILAIKVDGISKEYYAWGLRIGFITYGIKNPSKGIYDILENKTASVIRATTSNSPHISQMLTLQAITDINCDAAKKAKFTTLQKRFLKVQQIFSKNPHYKKQFTPLPFNSGYFVCLDLLEKDPKYIRQILLEKYNTGVIAIKGLLRVSYSAVPYDLLDELFQNIYYACIEN